MKYSEILKANDGFDREESLPHYKISILSNIMVHQTKEICEYSLRQEGIYAEVYLGDYDNILQESFKVKDSNAVVLFWEIFNLIDGLQFKIDILSSNDFKSLVERVKNEIDVTLGNLKNVPVILMNKFSSMVFDRFNVHSSRLRELANILNLYVEEKLLSNLKLIDIESIFSNLSVNNCVDLRYYYSSKTLYNIGFYKEYFDSIKSIFLSINGKSKKAIIFDCDNTLWKGVLGEDGYDGIKVYEEVQSLALALSRKGIILGLCSKNNPKDVDDVLENHKDMILRDKDIVIKKVNWDDKVKNIRSIAEDLNIGLDSLVFFDDSEFEVNFVKENLPMVSVFQVPKKEYQYSMMFREVLSLFYNSSYTKEDYQKQKLYKNEVQRKELKNQSGTLEVYLKSLELKIKVQVDNEEEVTRIAQLTQKTNQFNLTTKRFTEIDINNLMRSSNNFIISIQVLDKFGDNGIVGLAIINCELKIAKIDVFLMSCRVIGRNIEYKFMDVIVGFLRGKNIDKIKSNYIETLKNSQVSDLYNRFGFDIVDGTNSYELDLDKYNSKNIKYIEVEYAK
ncbi:MAG: HAD-IIIC family phosphatase [Marinomonas colpomeniae]